MENMTHLAQYLGFSGAYETLDTWLIKRFLKQCCVGYQGNAGKCVSVYANEVELVDGSITTVWSYVSYDGQFQEWPVVYYCACPCIDIKQGEVVEKDQMLTTIKAYIARYPVWPEVVEGTLEEKT